MAIFAFKQIHETYARAAFEDGENVFDAFLYRDFLFPPRVGGVGALKNSR